MICGWAVSLLSCTEPPRRKQCTSSSVKAQKEASAKEEATTAVKQPHVVAHVVVSSQQWNKKFELLRQYKTEHGDTHVPPANPLGT